MIYPDFITTVRPIVTKIMWGSFNFENALQTGGI